MSSSPPGRRELHDVVEDEPFRGGVTGIALVALATLGLAAMAAVLVALAILVAG